MRGRCFAFGPFLLDAGRGVLLRDGAAVALGNLAFRFQHKDEPLHRAVARRFPAAAKLESKSARLAWASDTLNDVGPGQTE